MVDAGTVTQYWTRYEWSAEELEPGVWRSTFSTEQETDFDLYVMLTDDWVHFAVSPLVHGSEPAALPRYCATVLALNQLVRLVRFAIDEAGDTNLLADSPRGEFSYSIFAQTIDLLTSYTDELGKDLRRLAYQPDYDAPNLPSITC